MIGNAHRANPLSHALRRASSPERGSFFVWRQGLPVRELPLLVKKVAQKRPQAFLSHKL